MQPTSQQSSWNTPHWCSGPMPGYRPVPCWEDLPSYAQHDLENAGFGKKWYEEMDALDGHPLMLTALVLYVKLKGMGLWSFVNGSEVNRQYLTCNSGELQFYCRNHPMLKALLTARPDFTNPEASDVKWSSREKRSVGSLHIRKYELFVQAHIDYYGLLRNGTWWVAPPVQLAQMAAHGLSQQSRRDVCEVRELLLAQGWDPAPLVGKAYRR